MRSGLGSSNVTRVQQMLQARNNFVTLAPCFCHALVTEARRNLDKCSGRDHAGRSLPMYAAIGPTHLRGTRELASAISMQAADKVFD
jgi:hypothetical protein